MAFIMNGTIPGGAWMTPLGFGDSKSLLVVAEPTTVLHEFPPGVPGVSLETVFVGAIAFELRLCQILSAPSSKFGVVGVVIMEEKSKVRVGPKEFIPHTGSPGGITELFFEMGQAEPLGVTGGSLGPLFMKDSNSGLEKSKIHI